VLNFGGIVTAARALLLVLLLDILEPQDVEAVDLR
jgi:hypothetical protein